MCRTNLGAHQAGYWLCDSLARLKLGGKARVVTSFDHICPVLTVCKLDVLLGIQGEWSILVTVGQSWSTL